MNSHIISKIVHISDLHFGLGFDGVGWEQVKDLIRRERPDLILVTGDLVNSPWPFVLARARSELRMLASDSGSSLVVIPGNHDIGIWGNIPFFLLRRFFEVAFLADSKDAERLNSVPAFSVHAAKPFMRRLGSSMSNWCKLWPWFLIQSFLVHPRVLPDVFPSEHALVLRVDSNLRMRLATGRITTRTIDGVQKALRVAMSAPDFQPLIPRIALLHHHPIQIPWSDLRERPTSFEPFLALRNGGTLLQLLVDAQFDLVLHGHRHHHGVARISHELGADEGSGVVVLAAASAGVRLESTVGKTVTMIEIKRNGRIQVEVVKWGQQNPPVRSNKSGTMLHGISEFKRRSFLRAVRTQRLECDQLVRRVEIDDYGGAKISHMWTELRAHGADVNQIEQTSLTSIGQIDPDSIKMESTCNAVLAHHASKLPLRCVRIPITFAPPLPGDGSTECTLTLEYVTHNAFLLSRWEAIQVFGSDRPAEDDFGARISIPTRRLVIDVILPKEALGGAVPEIRCELPPGFPRLQFDPGTRQVTPGPNDEYVAKATWTDTELSLKENSSRVQLNDQTWRFQVEYPLVGVTYSVVWGVSAPWERESVPRARHIGQTKAIRKRFVDYAARARQGTQANRESTRALLQDLLRTFDAEYRSTFSYDVKSSLTLHVYSEETRSLIVAETVRNWQQEPSWDFSVPLGDGIVGSCFKQGRIILYLDPSLKPKGAAKGWYLFDTGERYEPPYMAVLAIPLFCPERAGQTRPDPEVTVGVMSFATTASDSGLLRLDGTEPSKNAQTQTIFGLTQAFLLAALA